MTLRGGVVLTRALGKLDSNVELALSLLRYDGVRLLGKASPVVAGVPTVQWNATLRRYTRQGQVSASVITEAIQTLIEPRALVDPRYPPSGLTIRIRDTLHLLVGGTPPPWNVAAYGRASWGFRAGSVTSGSGNGTPFVGFRADIFGPSTPNPTWKADFVNWDSTTRISKDTGISVGTLHDLMVELSGPDQKIRWYIDGFLVHTLAPNANDVGGQNAAPAAWTVFTDVAQSSFAGGSPTLTLTFHAGLGPLLTCAYA